MWNLDTMLVLLLSHKEIKKKKKAGFNVWSMGSLKKEPSSTGQSYPTGSVRVTHFLL